MNTDLEQLASTPQNTLGETVFMGSGLGPTGRPGMTRDQALRSADRRVSKDAPGAPI